MCVTLMNPRTGGVFASFGAHPSRKWRWSAA
jgi:ribosomal protein S12 methylthiotransferase accessory factor YcaO